MAHRSYSCFFLLNHIIKYLIIFNYESHIIDTNLYKSHDFYYFCSAIFKQTQRIMKQAKAQWGRYPLGYPWRVAGTKSRASNIPCRSKGRSSSGNSRYKGSVWHHWKIMKNRRCSPEIASSCIIVAFRYVIYPQPKISNTFGAKRPARPNIDGHDPPKP